MVEMGLIRAQLKSNVLVGYTHLSAASLEEGAYIRLYEEKAATTPQYIVSRNEILWIEVLEE